MTGMLMVADGGGGAADGATEAAGATEHAAMTAQEMLDGHRESVEAFPAETAGAGNRPLKPVLDHGVKVFEITATEVEWEVSPGMTKSAMAYNGQIPGPELRVSQGDRVRVVFQNQLSQPSSVHFHGLTVPFEMDGVPYITQDPTLPGEYYEYEFTVKDPPGTYVYHSHFNSTEQVGKGLYGAFIVEPDGKAPWDVEYTLFTGDGPLDYNLNAKSFPATTPIVASKGDTVLIRMANDGAMIHPMHLHGYHFKVVSEDGFPLEQPYWADTLMVAPGQRFDVLVGAKYPGVWAFHCHILPHVEGPQGMFGMVTALIVE
jgi:FtsP/CotA-like multicopper oxidase with cupredoxin domain